MTDRPHAVLYLRSATTNDHAIAEQRVSCVRYAEARGWGIHDVIVDNGAAGLGRAPGLALLRERIADGTSKLVIASDLDRISRDLEQCHGLAQLCREHGAHVYLAERGMALDTLLGADIAQSGTLGDVFAAREARS